MSDKELSSRQKEILLHCQFDRSYSLREIAQTLSGNLGQVPSVATLRRDLGVLCDLGFFKQLGDRKSTKYQLDSGRQVFAPIDAHRYCGYDIDERPGNHTFNFNLFPNVPIPLFTTQEMVHLNEATGTFQDSAKGASQTICKRELERFVIELSWKSSKIEGNTYTLLDTELLIKEGIEAAGRSREEAVMILNHKRGFDFILKARTEFVEPKLSVIQDLHRCLVEGLGISYGLRQRLIGITGSLYKPLQVPSQIQEACLELLGAVMRQPDPYSRALLALAGIGYIQPFEDGNKRTSRLTANAILIAANCAPLSYRSIGEIAYREAMLTFYEKNSILPLKELFMQQYLFACENYLKFA